MTDKEQIAKMAKEVCKYVQSRKIEKAYILEKPKDEMFQYSHNYGLAEALYNAGYRKAKETAKEIFNTLIKIAVNEFGGTLPLGVLKAWAIEYGVEVENDD